MRRTTPLSVGILMGLSGGATLAGEALGARALRPLLGSTALAQTGTLVGVLGALGLGAWWAGRQRRWGFRAVLVGAHAGLALVALLGALAPRVLTDPFARALVALSLRAPAAGDVARLVLAVALTAAPGFLAGAPSARVRSANEGSARRSGAASAAARAAAKVTPPSARRAASREHRVT